MDSLYGLAVSLAVPVFVALIAIELAVDAIRGTRYYHFADAINNLSCGMVSNGTRVFFGFLGLVTYRWMLDRAPLHLSAKAWPVWVFAFVLYDFCYYWQHRLGHTVGLFWASHSVHHQSEEFNLTTALRQPGTGAFTNWIFYVPMALCGVPVSVFLMVAVIQLFYQFWPHTRMIGRLGVLDRWIQTPSNHRVHHAQNDVYLDRNYVGVFVLWDRLFGTFQEELDEEPCIYGVRGQLKSWNPVWANLHYYSILLRDSLHARRWRDKLRVWWAPPGWRPADVAARFPKPPYDPRRDFERYDPPRSTTLSLYVLAQFALLMAAHSHWLAELAKQPVAVSVAYYLFLLASLVALGGLLENRRVFRMLEAGRLILVAAGVLGLGEWFGGVRDAAARMGIMLAAIASLAWLSWSGRPGRAEAAGGEARPLEAR
ncbi:MAG TPA: sterol desaturase family protein [Bryobacteraceae bacterium]|nr:sterol desaturase family protein [Bryobacteraceae bacterium]